jgi:K+-transporting ATPase ATPase C chain
MRDLWIAAKMTAVLTIITGIAYPLVVFALAHIFFPWQADGSLITNSGRIVGSQLVGQTFSEERYFHGRPSAAGAKGYDAENSGGSNLGPTNKALISAVDSRVKAVLEENPGIQASDIPVDLVTASGSGLDPEISPAAAEIQVGRVARARGISPGLVRSSIRENTRGRMLGAFGEPGVNVLKLNLALDALGPDAGKSVK